MPSPSAGRLLVLALALVAGLLVTVSAPAVARAVPQPQAGDLLGTRWEICEDNGGSVCGVWVRQETGDTWAVTWETGVSGEATVTVVDHEVTADAVDSTGMAATYTGTVNQAGAGVGGWMTRCCDDSGEQHAWSAVIYQDDLADQLGTQWDVSELYAERGDLVIYGTWVRQDAGDTWTGEWDDGSTGTLTVVLDGATVTITRVDDSGAQGTYTGTLVHVPPDPLDPEMSAGYTSIEGTVTWCCDEQGTRNGEWSASVTHPQDGLGSQWHVCDVGATTVCGTWVRQGASNTWSGTWDDGATSVLDITVVGDTVSVYRTDPSGLEAIYDGTLSADGTQVSGTVTWCCDSPEPPRDGNWAATIQQ